MASKWIEFVKAYSKKHNISYKEAMSKAKASYKPDGKAKGMDDKIKPVKKKVVKRVVKKKAEPEE